MLVKGANRLAKREGRSEMRTGTFRRGQKLRTHIGVIAVSLVAMFGAALVPVARAAAANATSVDFAGYQATSSSTFGSASVKFTLPAIHCLGSGTNVDLFGSFLNLYPEEAAVLVECSGRPSYYGLIGGKPDFSFVPSRGDLVKTTVAMSTAGNKATLTDVTQHRSISTSFVSSSGPTVAYDGVSTYMCIFNCGYDSADNFGKVRMFDATLNGMTPTAAGATAVNMQVGSVPEVATRALDTTGNAWTEVWKAF
jgi:hypothetical protein